VVAANKRPLVVPWPRREHLFAVRRASHTHYHYETTVGASLPVIDTLKTWVRTGDRVRAVEGVLSGTLGFALGEVAKGNPLSMAMRWARALGYTEPEEYADLIREIKNNVPNIGKAVISVHCHNDLGLATANSLSAIKSGARQVECTINGIGERAGSASLEEIVMAVKTRKDIFAGIQTSAPTCGQCPGQYSRARHP
jgi:hypothetical protein